ncbi:hypothetical protein GOBAR_DD36047 [Gossypium barbadense]|nr:hypothetical protein GOBAR_DD36047 [Gossypium barbadense]
MCTSPAVYPSDCGVGEALINDDVNTRKGETSSTAVIVAIPIADNMEELCVRLDENTVKKVVRAFQELSQEDKQKLVLRRYMIKWKYIHFNGEQVRVKRYTSDED